MVSALTATPGEFYDSPADSGYSVDNPAPGVPSGLLVVADNQLSWIEPVDIDFRNFTVYTAASSTLDETAVVLDHTVETSLVLSGPALGYSLLTATDFAGNESEPFVLDSVSAVPGVGVPVKFALRANHPNPFNPATVISFDLATDTKVRRVYLTSRGVCCGSWSTTV